MPKDSLHPILKQLLGAFTGNGYLHPIMYLYVAFVSIRREAVSKQACYILLVIKVDMAREIIGYW